MVEALVVAVAIVSLAMLALPFWSLFRIRQIGRRVEHLARRVETLEAAAHGASAAPASDAGEKARPPLTPPATQATPQPAEPLTPARDVPAATPVRTPAIDIEERIGGRWLLYVGLLTLLIGVSFFLKYAFDNAWVGPAGRTVIGVLAGVGVVLAGLGLTRRGVTGFGVALAGGGLAIVYLSIYAAVALYGLIDSGLAFAAMTLVAGTAAWLAARHEAQPLAVLGIGGGFLTPFLVGAADTAPFLLLAYDALLVASAVWLVARYAWRGLAATSYLLTVATLCWWAFIAFEPERWLTTLGFLTLFVVLFAIMLRGIRRQGPSARAAAALLWTAPPAYHLAALVLTSGHPPALNLYVIAAALAAVIATTDPHRPWIRLLALGVSLAPLFGASVLPSGRSWLVANSVTVAAVAGLFLGGCLDRLIRQRARLSTPDLVTLHVAGLGMYGLLYQATLPYLPGLRGILAFVIAGAAAAAASLLRDRDRVTALNATALALTLVAIGIAVQLDGRSVVVGWAAEGAAVMWLGIRFRQVLFRAGGLVLWLAAVGRLAGGYFTTLTTFTPVLNERSLATLFLVASGYVLIVMLRRKTVAEGPALGVALHVVCSSLVLMWIPAKIRSYWELRPDRPEAHLSEQLMLSLGWGIYGAAAVTAGLWRGYAPLRYIGIAVIVLTVLKVFFIDIWGLGGVYRIVGFVTLGLLLVLVSYLYQRTRGSETPTDRSTA